MKSRGWLYAFDLGSLYNTQKSGHEFKEPDAEVLGR